jgi:hypothetical protein
MPTAPTISPAALRMSTPPGTGIMRPALTAASAVKKAGTLAARAASARAEAHAQRSPGLAEGNVEAKQPGFVLALERDQMTAAIENGDGQRSALELAPFAQCDIDDGGSLGKIYH